METLAAQRVWKANLARKVAIIHPSKAYAGVWLRDSFWALLGLGNAKLAAESAGHFAARQLPDGQVPTQFESFLLRPIYHADESTLLYLIWARWQAQQRSPMTSLSSLRRALSYVRLQAHDGYYLSRPGSYDSWFDGFKLPATDTLSYNQGLYAVALLSAQALGLKVGAGEIQAAITAYRSLVDRKRGYLRFSRRLDYHDISGLMGDFLADWLFRHPLLPNSAVQATIRTQPEFQGGFKVVTDAQGRALPHQKFVMHFFPGDYQNGGSWLLFDYVALADGCLRHIPGLERRLVQRLYFEFRHKTVFHEYLNTDAHSHLYGGEEAYRDNFSWDTFILRVDAVLAAHAA